MNSDLEKIRIKPELQRANKIRKNSEVQLANKILNNPEVQRANEIVNLVPDVYYNLPTQYLDVLSDLQSQFTYMQNPDIMDIYDFCNKSPQIPEDMLIEISNKLNSDSDFADKLKSILLSASEHIPMTDKAKTLINKALSDIKKLTPKQIISLIITLTFQMATFVDNHINNLAERQFLEQQLQEYRHKNDLLEQKNELLEDSNNLLMYEIVLLQKIVSLLE